MEKRKRSTLNRRVLGLRIFLAVCFLTIGIGMAIFMLLMQHNLTEPLAAVPSFDHLPCLPADIQPSAERRAWADAHFAICATSTTVSVGEQIILVAQPINVHRNYPDQCVITELVQNPVIFHTGMQLRDCNGAAMYVLEAVQPGMTEVYFFSPQVVMYPPEISFNGTDDVYSASLNITVTH